MALEALSYGPQDAMEDSNRSSIELQTLSPQSCGGGELRLTMRRSFLDRFAAFRHIKKATGTESRN
jgi:hypothetical protein